MTCEICDTPTATMWVQAPIPRFDRKERLLSCDDCGPQAGYVIVAPLEMMPNDRA